MAEGNINGFIMLAIGLILGGTVLVSVFYVICKFCRDHVYTTRCCLRSEAARRRDSIGSASDAAAPACKPLKLPVEHTLDECSGKGTPQYV